MAAWKSALENVSGIGVETLSFFSFGSAQADRNCAGLPNFRQSVVGQPGGGIRESVQARAKVERAGPSAWAVRP